MREQLLPLSKNNIIMFIWSGFGKVGRSNGGAGPLDGAVG